MALGKVTRVPKPTDIRAEDHPEQRKRASATEVVDFRDSCRHRDILERSTVFRYRAPSQPTTGIQHKIQQDPAGGHAATFEAIGAELEWEGNSPPDLTLTEPGKVCLLEFDFDGSVLLGSMRSQNHLFA
jgi:hypothetical protein